MLLREVIITIFLITLTSESCRIRSGIVRISAPGCTTKEIYTKGCYGRCSTFTIPRISPPGDFASVCSCCYPVRRQTRRYTLSCIESNKTAELSAITKCKCRPCYQTLI